MKYHIITYGCQMNHSDSERIASVLEDIGYQPASNEKEADLIVVNACSVRQSAIDRIWGLLPKFEKLKNKNKELKTVLTGCVLSADKKKFAKRLAPYGTQGSDMGFDLILDIKDLPKLSLKIRGNLNSKLAIKNYLEIKPRYQSQFSASVPIMTGCNNFCSFCVVPYTRGREISRSVEDILCEVRNLVERGYKEIWLLGQNVNSYNSEQKIRNNEQKINFPKLLKMVNNIPGNFWVRFTSSHPKDFSEELISTIAGCKKITEYLNLPIQSGDDEILKKMNRPYTIEQYKNLVKKIRGEIPNISLSTDVIVGFPGETEKQFKNTVRLFEEIKYDMAYIAKFSSRAGTAAAKLKDNIPRQEKERRWNILASVLKKTALEKNQEYTGKIIDVLPEEIMGSFLVGKTRGYKTVRFKGPINLIGNFIKVKILEALPWGLKGELKNEA